MTFDELKTLCGERLKAYESRLDVRGKKRPYSDSAKILSEICKCTLSTTRPEGIQQVIDTLLDRLAELKDGFVMSEPNIITPVGLERGYEADTVIHNNLTLTLMHQTERTQAEPKEMVRVQCWYYPG
jgi:hypothetical protein